MNDNPIQKLADAYSDYRDKQRKKRIMTLLGVLGVGAAGVFGYGKFRNAQVQKLLQQAAKKRKMIGTGIGAAGLGFAAPYAYNAMQNDPSVADTVQGGVRSMLDFIPGALESAQSNPHLSRLLQGDASEAVGGFRDDIMDRMRAYEGIPGLSGIQDSISGLFDKIL